MKQHSIPQDITNYKFHLIGSMTLKQFAELVAGAIVAFIIYSSNLISIVKWPLFIIVIILAIMIAFVPIEERPLDYWIITFVKNLWKPTKFFWKKTPKVPDFFHHKPGEITQAGVDPKVNYSPARKSRIQEYLKSIPTPDDDLDSWDKHRKQQAQQLIADFDEVKIKAENIDIKKENKAKPQLKTKVRSLSGSQDQSKKPPIKPVAPVAEKNIGGEANQVSGQVQDSEGRAINSALVEIYNQELKQTLRLIKTNQEGKFKINSTIPNGHYTVTVESKNLIFPETKLELNGQVVTPLSIKAN